MPKKKGKGGKRGKKDEKRELVFKKDGQEYAQVMRMLVNGRCQATCIYGVKRFCHIPRNMHKNLSIAAGDIILLALPHYQDEEADVILKYMPDEAMLLKAYGDMEENARLNVCICTVEDEDDGDGNGNGDGDDYIEFEEEDIDKL